MFAIKSKDGFGFFGEDGGILGPCRIYYDTEPQPLAAGTIQVTGNSATGTGTSFTTLFNFDEGDIYLKANTSPNPTLLRVKQITSNTSMTVLNPKTLEDANVTIPAGTTFSLFRTIDLGRTNEEGVKIKIEEKRAPIKSAQEGDVDFNHFSTGHELTIEFTLLETSIEKLLFLSKGSVHAQRNVDGLITGVAIGNRIGRNFRKNAKQIAIVKYKDGGISTDPLDRLEIFHFHPTATIEQSFDATSPHVLKITGVAYMSDTYTIDGKGYFGAVNYTSISWD